MVLKSLIDEINTLSNICADGCNFAETPDSQQTAIEMLNKRNGNRVNILH